MSDVERKAAVTTGRSVELAEREALPLPGPQAPSHAGRFHVVYVLLAAAAVGVIALGIHTATKVRPPTQPAAVKHRWHAVGPTSFAVTKSIAHHYTALELKGLEAQGPPRIIAQRPAEIHLGALQVPVRQSMFQIAIPPTDAVYQICGHGQDCSLVEPPSIKRELLLRRLALSLVVDTFRAPHAPKHAIVSLPALPGQLWLVVYSRDEFSDKTLAKTHTLLTRMAKAHRQRTRDVAMLTSLTDGRAFAVAQQAQTEDEKLVFILQPRPCMDSACPGQ